MRWTYQSIAGGGCEVDLPKYVRATTRRKTRPADRMKAVTKKLRTSDLATNVCTRLSSATR